MNRHFATTDFQDDASYRRPTRLYGLLDHLERGGQYTLAAFDCVDAEWIDNRPAHPQFGAYFDADHPKTVEDRWHDFWQGVNAKGPSPLDDMPVFRIEVELPRLSDFAQGYGHGAEDFDHELAFAESIWLEIGVAEEPSPDAWPALLYHGMFLPPNPVFARASKASKAKAQLLSTITSLKPVPIANPAALLGAAEADFLGVWDVGQGNANALLDASGRASAYFDVGCGVYRNAWTCPSNLEFCWGGSGPIVLSHWDADHWAGAELKTPSGAQPALSREWIVPDQKITPVHVAFAASIAAGHLWRITAGTSFAIRGGRQLTLALGTGASRNHSGVVMLIENGPSGSDSWLLTGDCDYKYFTALSLTQVAALVVPHHGASLAPGSTPPGPGVSGYRRVIYSFGANNAHGKATMHPTVAGVAAHDKAGWLHGSWVLPPPPKSPPPAPGMSVAGADVLATAQHVLGATRTTVPPPPRLDGIYVGWTLPSPGWKRCPTCPGTCAPALRQT